MEMYCIKCSAPLGAFDNYCCFCGAEAPRGTIAADVEARKIEKGIYCPHCGHTNLKEALFCSDCGKHLYEKPRHSPFFCPRCAGRNSLTADYCFKCSISFKEWFAMKGEIAAELGYKGNFILFETMNNLFYHFIKDDSFTIGRGSDNDFVLPAGWVSSRHCTIDLKNNRLLDNGSANGTYINRKGDKIKSVPLNMVGEFNIAGIFTFNVVHNADLFIFRLTAVLDEEGLKKQGILNMFNELRDHYFILIKGSAAITIRKMDGEILDSSDEKMEYFTIEINEDGYYFSDQERGLKRRLLLKKYNNLPINWNITMDS
jgi:DNA-directed RNA polymerase subunit RPC12/RpoP